MLHWTQDDETPEETAANLLEKSLSDFFENHPDTFTEEETLTIWDNTKMICQGIRFAGKLSPTSDFA